jgi:hypothetical protein
MPGGQTGAPQPAGEPQDRQQARTPAPTSLEQPVKVVETAKAEGVLRTASAQDRRGDPGPDRLDGVDGEALFGIPRELRCAHSLTGGCRSRR